MRSSITIAALAAVVTLAASANASLHKPNNHIAIRSALENNGNSASFLNSATDEFDELEDEADALIKREDFYDDDGKVIEIFDDGGDPAGEDEGAASLVRRRKAAASCGTTTKKSKKTTKTKAHANAKKASSTSTSSSKGDLLSSQIMITWYASEDLKNPACGTGTWDPTSNAHIGAIATGWKDGPACGEFIDLCNEDVKPHKCVTVRRVDDCAGCDNNHVDLTKAAFKALSPSGGLDEGIVKNLKMYKTKKANPWNLSLFGPIKLSIW